MIKDLYRLLVSPAAFQQITSSRQPLSLDSLLQVLTSGRNGWVYGTKLRFAHSLTLLLFFSRTSSFKQLRIKLWRVFQNSQKHGLSLTSFAFSYKLLLLVLKSVEKRKTNNATDHFIAGFLGGYLVYGNQIPYFSNSISHQVTIYIFARVVLALAKLAGEELTVRIVAKQSGFPIAGTPQETVAEIKKSLKYKKLNQKLTNTSWNFTAALTWGLIMMLWKYQRHTLNKSMNESMDYIYGQYDWLNFIGFFRNQAQSRK